MSEWHVPLAAASQGGGDGAPLGGVGSLVLTGATGFIGGSVLVAAVNAGLARRLLCLVRAGSPQEALARLRANAVQSGLLRTRAEWLTEANVIVGALGSEFGPRDLERLRDATHVINCAALASFSSDRSVMQTNLDDTLRFASCFAGSTRLRRFLHVGTAMACGINRGPQVTEPAGPAADAEHLVPYTRSKQEVEAQLRRCCPDLPLVIARPSVVVGHTVLGTLPSGSIFWLFRIVHRVRCFTMRPTSRVDVIAVDDCAHALLRLAVKPHLAFDEYHLSAGGAAPTVSQVMAAMDDAVSYRGLGGYTVCRVRDLPVIARDVARAERIRHSRLIERALRVYAGFANLGYVFDNRRIREEIGFEPLSFTDYVSECVRTSRGVGILEQMSWDFR